MPKPNDLVTFDLESARRIGKAVRRFENMQTGAEPSASNRSFSIIEIFVPRSLAAGIYTGDVYWYDPSTGNITLALEDQTAELLPDTL